MRRHWTRSGVVLTLTACSATPTPVPEPAATAAQEPSTASLEAPSPADASAHAIQASAETIYMWGGLFNDESLEAPVPLTRGVLQPGEPLDIVAIRCLIRGPQDKASVRCNAKRTKERPHLSEQARERLDACTELRERSPRRAEVKAIEKSWKTIVAGENFAKRGLSWSMSRYEPPDLSASKPTVYEVIVRHEWRGPETRTGGCENPPPNTGCDPFVIETGRMTTLHQETVGFAYSGNPGQAISNFFGGRAPSLHRMRIGVRNERGTVQDDPALKVEGAKKGIEDYRRRQLAALDAFADSAEHQPDVAAAIHINRAITALHLRDLDLLRRETQALRALDKASMLDRAALYLDEAFAVYDRVLAGEWLLSDPCEGKK